MIEYHQLQHTLNNNINNERGSKNWVDFVMLKKQEVFSCLCGVPFSRQVWCRLCHTDIIDFANHKANIEIEVLLFW